MFICKFNILKKKCIYIFYSVQAKKFIHEYGRCPSRRRRSVVVAKLFPLSWILCLMCFCLFPALWPALADNVIHLLVSRFDSIHYYCCPSAPFYCSFQWQKVSVVSPSRLSFSFLLFSFFSFFKSCWIKAGTSFLSWHSMPRADSS